MRILKLCLVLHLFWCVSYAQNITLAEYYFDGNDLGFGANDSFLVNQMNETTTTIPTTGLGQGFHDLYIRVFDQAANGGVGAWSHYDRVSFYISEFPSNQNIVAARYYFNDDMPQVLSIDSPGVAISQAYQIDTSSLEEGFHDFYIQTQIADGTWSLYDRATIFIKDFSAVPSDLVAAEYFIDEDPGYGLGNSFSISGSPEVLNVTTDSGISEGDHLLCVRVQNADGEWSLYCCAPFNVDETVGVEESLYQSIKVFPNPFVDDIQITTQYENEIEEAVVFDMTGKVVYEKYEQLDKLSLDNLEQGTYFLKLTSNSKAAIFKIVKE